MIGHRGDCMCDDCKLAGLEAASDAAEEAERLRKVHADGRRVGLERMNDLFKQGFWPWNRKRVQT